MKSVCLLLLIAASPWVAQAADERIYRCGNEYTNTVTDAQTKNCKLISGGNITIIQAVKPPAPKVMASGPRAADQRAKDADARLILDSELKRAEARQAELVKEYNGGQPDPLGPEARNHQKYLERVGALKAALDRNNSDLAGIQREISRLAPASAGSEASSASAGK